MGHVQPSGAAAGPQEGLAADDLWPLWRALVRHFRLWRLLGLLWSPSGWGFYGVDVISTLRSAPASKSALVMLRGMTDVQLERLARMAELNARRNEAHWRMAALFYITVPGSLFLAALQGAPESTREMVRDLGWWATVLILGVMAQMLYYFATQWRARQIEAVIELARIERMGAARPEMGKRPRPKRPRATTV